MYRREVYGYHGTSQTAAALIVHGTFLPSNNRYDWLGDGIYFWEEAPERAWEWARQVYGDDAAVVASRLLLDSCMDLAERHWQEFLAEVYRSFAHERKQRGRAVPRQRPNSGSHPLDRVIINRAVVTLAQQGIVIRVVRSPFREGKRLYPWSALYSHQHVQIAVRDTALIVSSALA